MVGFVHDKGEIQCVMKCKFGRVSVPSRIRLRIVIGQSHIADVEMDLWSTEDPSSGLKLLAEVQ
jgi:hypothetical protein